MAVNDEVVDITVDGQQIHGTLLGPVRPESAGPQVLFIHGWGGTQEQYLGRARAIAALGWACLTFDLRGHARWEALHDTVTREDNLRDVLAAYDLLTLRHGLEGSDVAVVGSSYGGYLAAILTELRPVRWLALRAPALYTDEGWELPKCQLNQNPELMTYRRRIVVAEENRALRACAAFRGDVLLVESEHDDVVPHPVLTSYREACVRAHSVKHHVIQGADHGLSEEVWRQEYTSILVNWLTQTTVSASLLEPEKPSEPAHPFPP
jgi:pimeloyl-ACP methyl ester carboxylesterase